MFIRRFRSPGSRGSAALLALCLLALGLGDGGAQNSPAQPDCATADVHFDHSSGLEPSFSLAVADHKPFTICIGNTAPRHFTYEIGGIERPAEPGAELKAQSLGATPAPEIVEDKWFTQVHDAKYIGYVIRIRKLDPASTRLFGKQRQDGTVEPVGLKEATLLVHVRTVGWQLEFAGGFTFSLLTDPVFAARKDPNQPSSPAVVFRDEKAENEISLATAAMIHAYSERFPHGALSFGLGVNTSSEPNYLLGLTWRMGDRAALTGGYVFGSVNRLPSGIRNGDPLSDPNVLNTLGKRTAGAPFFGISYTFLGSRGRFEKFFAGQQEPTRVTSPGSGSSTTVTPTRTGTAGTPTPTPTGAAGTLTPTPTTAAGAATRTPTRTPPASGLDPFVEGAVKIEIRHALEPPFGLPGPDGGPQDAQDYFVIGNLLFEEEGAVQDPTRPILELSLRGKEAAPCTARPCGEKVGLAARYSSNIFNDRTQPEARHCGSGWNYHDRLPLGSLGPEDTATIEVRWSNAGVITIRANGFEDVIRTRVCPGTVAFRGFRPGLAEGIRGWVTLPRFSHLDARAKGVEVTAEPVAGTRGLPRSCPADCGP